jgi:hypothetical protein
MWDRAEGKEFWSKPWSQPHAGDQSVIFSPDGKWLVAARSSRTQGLVLVDAANGDLRIEVTRHRMSGLVSFSFRPDGKYLPEARKMLIGYERMLNPRALGVSGKQARAYH